MPKAYPREFRDDVVAVAQRREPGVTIKEIADDFGISETCLQNWLRQADVEAGRKPAVRRLTRRSCVSCVSATGCWSRRTRSCAGQLPICRRRTCREKALPARERAGRGRDSRRGDVSGIEACSPAVLTVAGQPRHGR